MEPLRLPKLELKLTNPNGKGVGFKQWIIWYAIVLHWIWGVSLLSSDSPLGVTAVSSIVSLGVVSSMTAGIYFLLISCLALVGLGAPKKVGVWFILPQSLTLIFSAYGAIMAMVAGRFADGVPRPASFLIADQAPAVIAAFFHLVAVTDNYLTKD